LSPCRLFAGAWLSPERNCITAQWSYLHAQVKDSYRVKISREEVEHIASLARLELTESEIEQLESDLSRILEYVGQLSELDTSAVPPTAHVVVQEDVLRDDVPRPSLPTADILANAPHAEEGFFRVHAVLPKGDQ
jgi:aspartyl-tRNA(Asn)/glutamyl-tRNA(Gln) amidotransferase subunit C